MQNVLRAAMELHQTGQLAEAAELYQKVLAGDQTNADALHLLGVLLHQQGEHARAIELIGRAVVLRPNAAAFHANLAEPYRALGQLDRAAGCCRAALNLRPDYPEALGNLGLALQGLGKHDEAVEQLRHAIRVRPDFAAAHNNLGNVLREKGELDEALTHFRQAVELDPRYAPARTNLGQLLLDRGKAEEALPHCEEAVRLQPEVAALHHNLANVYRDLKRFAEARSAYLGAIRLDPKLAKAHAHLGLSVMREGQTNEAIPWIKRAIELDPGDPAFPEILADVQMEQEEYANAATNYRQAINLSTESRPILHLALGWALQEDGRLEEAAEEYRIAERQAPEMPAVQNYLGGYYEERGELDLAEAAYRQALKLQPSFALPHARLGTLLRGKVSDGDLASLEKRLDDPEMKPEARGRLLFGLAHVLDARGDYVRAAATLQEANAVTLENKIGRRYNPADHERFIDNMIKFFDARYFARAARWGLATRRPVFIFGLPRSGTTLIEQVLASHSRVFGAGEQRFGRLSFEAIPAAVGRTGHPMECVGYLDAASIARIGEQHLDRLRTLAGEKADRVTDKMPDNYIYFGYLATLFPRATFIHCRRDLRDVAVSCWMTDFRAMLWASSPEHIANRFYLYRKIMEHWKSVVAVPFIDVDYEETVDNLEGVARRVVAACGLEWEPACLEFYRTKRPIRTASITQVRQPVYKQSVARWKNYQDVLGDLFTALTADPPRDQG
jgi:tetratricopeptide (TPR) repeat protein